MLGDVQPESTIVENGQALIMCVTDHSAPHTTKSTMIKQKGGRSKNFYLFACLCVYLFRFEAIPVNT